MHLKTEPVTKIQSASFVGVFDGNEIKTVRMLPVEKIDNKINMNDIMINKKGNSFIYTVQYFDYNSKADTIKFYKTKTYLYKIQK